MAVDIKLLATRLCPAASQVILPQTVVSQPSRRSCGNLIQTAKSYNIPSVCLFSYSRVQKPTYVSKRKLFQSKNCLSLFEDNSLSLTLFRSLDFDRGLTNLIQPNANRCPRNIIQHNNCLSLLENNDYLPITVFRPSNPDKNLRNLIQQKKYLSLLTDNECFSLTLFRPTNSDRRLRNDNKPKNLSIINDSSSLTLFRPLNSDRRLKSLLQDTDSIKHLQGYPKTFFFRRRNVDEDGKKPKRRIPKLILIQNPFTWFMTKIDFTILRSIWDPAFKEKEFKYGTQQAIAKVTNVISDGHLTELNGLLTKAARLSLMRELDRNWSEKQRSLLSLDRNDIQITSPRKVYFIRIADKKYCDVDMAFLALKWVPINSIEALIFTEIFARFHREYTPHSIPEWTIAYFKVTRFEVLRRKPKA